MDGKGREELTPQRKSWLQILEWMMCLGDVKDTCHARYNNNDCERRDSDDAATRQVAC